MAESRKSKTRDPGETRERLIEAAAEAFRTVGYHQTDTNRIARDAGFAPQTFYRHFEDKRAVFLEVYRRWGEALGDRIAGADPVRTVQAIIAHHKAWGVFRASLIALDATDPEVRRVRIEERRRQLAALAKTTGAGREELLYFMWCVERVADGIAGGEPRAFSVGAKAMTDLLVASAASIFNTGTRPNH